MLQALVTAVLQLVLTSQNAFPGTSGVRGSSGTAVLWCLSSAAGEKHDQMLVPESAGVGAPGVCEVPGEESRGIECGKLVQGE